MIQYLSGLLYFFHFMLILFYLFVKIYFFLDEFSHFVLCATLKLDILVFDIGQLLDLLIDIALVFSS